jgi:hypothetical protein
MREQKIMSENFYSLNSLAKWIWHGGFTASYTPNMSRVKQSSGKLERASIAFDPQNTFLAI